MWEVKMYLSGNKEDPFKMFDTRAEAEEFMDMVERAMDNRRLIRFKRNNREFTVDGTYVAMVEMYQAY